MGRFPVILFEVSLNNRDRPKDMKYLLNRKKNALRLGILGLFLISFAALLHPPRTSAHIPITTKIMFDKEVIRILQRNCIECHRPGGIAFSLASYKDARPWAKAIEVELLEGRMPPWRPVNGYGDFLNTPKLTQQDMDLVVNWVENGVPEGDPKDLPKEPLFTNDWKLGKPDLLAEAGPSPLIKPGADEYASFAVPVDATQSRWIRALDLRPGNASIVHCATFYLTRGGSTGQHSEAQLEKLGTWIPGQSPHLPDNAAWFVPAGSQIVVKIHYKGSDEQSDPPATDTSHVGVYLAPKAPQDEILVAGVNYPDQMVPVSNAPHRVLATTTLADSAEVVGIRPLVSPLLASLQVTAYKPDGSEEVMLWTDSYTSDWAPDYYLRHPEKLPRGTRLEVVAYLDNSDDNRNNPNNPARSLRWADVSSGPLCSFLLARPESGT
ncbi:MAG TPA: cytochrome c [Blastocatellia bacterium]